MIGVETRSAAGWVAWAPGMSDEEASDSADDIPPVISPALLQLQQPHIEDVYWRPAAGGA